MASNCASVIHRRARFARTPAVRGRAHHPPTRIDQSDTGKHSKDRPCLDGGRPGGGDHHTTATIAAMLQRLIFFALGPGLRLQ